MYADHAATSWPVRFPPAAGDRWANASSGHRMGRAARVALDSARRSIAAAVNLTLTEPPEKHVLITSGGTESNNWIVQQSAWTFIVTTSVEHHSVFLPAQVRRERTRCRVVFLAPDAVGMVSPAALEAALPPTGTGLVSMMYVNNETGAVADLRALGDVVRRANERRGTEHRIWFHTDAVQAPGHVPLDLAPAGPLGAVDFVTLSAHKFYGPTGVGFLLVREPAAAPLEPMLFGGHQQGGMRPGTEPVAAVVAATEALQDATDRRTTETRQQVLRDMAALVWDTLLPFVVASTVVLTGPLPGPQRSPHIISFCVRGADRSELVARMEAIDDVLISGGSACTSDSTLPSHVLAAMGVPDAFIRGSMRISLGHTNTPTEVRNRLCPALRRLLAGVSKEGTGSLSQGA